MFLVSVFSNIQGMNYATLFRTIIVDKYRENLLTLLLKKFKHLVLLHIKCIFPMMMKKFQDSGNSSNYSQTPSIDFWQWAFL